MPRFTRRRHRFRDGGYGFRSDAVPSDYTFDRIKSKLKEFRASSDKLRLINSNTPTPSHWARQQEKEHMQAVQAQFTLERQQQQQAAAAAAAQGKPAPPPPPEKQVPKKPAPPEGTFAGARPELQSRLLVLDASFNPPTRAHAYMATAAVHDVLEEQRAGVAEAERYAAVAASIAGVAPRPVVRPETRLVLLLAVANADKAPQPASVEDRLAMIYAFARHLQEELRREGDSIPVEMALTSEPFFCGKAHALRTASWYPSMRPLMTFNKCDERGRKLPGKSNMPPMEFIVGFDTLVRILDPKYYKEEEEVVDAAAEKTDEGKEAVAGEAHQNDVDTEAAMEVVSYRGKGKEKMTAEDIKAEEALAQPPPPDSLAALLEARKRPQTPMMKALGPFFEHASLRVLLRPSQVHGNDDTQRRYIAALAGAEGEEVAAAGVCSLDEVGGDSAWMRKVRLLTEAPTGTRSVDGVSSSQVRRLVHDHGLLAAQGHVYPFVYDWIKKRELYMKPLPPPGTFSDDGGLVEITSFGAWRKEDFCD